LESIEAAKNSDAIALLTTAFCRANGAKNADAIELNPHRYRWMITEAKQEIPEAAARVCLDLIREGKLPHWALDLLNPQLKTIELAAK